MKFKIRNRQLSLIHFIITVWLVFPNNKSNAKRDMTDDINDGHYYKMAHKCCGLKLSLFGSLLCLVVAADVVVEVLFMHPYVQSRSDLCTTSCRQLLENFCISFSLASERDVGA